MRVGDLGCGSRFILLAAVVFWEWFDAYLTRRDR